MFIRDYHTQHPSDLSKEIQTLRDVLQALYSSTCIQAFGAEIDTSQMPRELGIHQTLLHVVNKMSGPPGNGRYQLMIDSTSGVYRACSVIEIRPKDFDFEEKSDELKSAIKSLITTITSLEERSKKMEILNTTGFQHAEIPKGRTKNETQTN